MHSVVWMGSRLGFLSPFNDGTIGLLSGGLVCRLCLVCRVEIGSFEVEGQKFALHY